MTGALAVLAACWAVGSVAAAIAVGRAIRLADNTACPHAESDADWLDPWPTECLSDAEVERRFARLVGWVE